MGGGPSFDDVAHSLATAVGIAKALVGAERAFDKAELKLKLADLMGELASARTDLAALHANVYRLAQELEETKNKLAFAGSMVFEAPYYFNVADGGRDGPYCATCWDGRGKLAIRLYEAVPGFWVCHTCKTELRDKTYRDPPMPDLQIG